MSNTKKRKTMDSPADPDNIKDDERWTDGDFELISSDNVRFKVPSYYLFAHSSVFRDAETLADGEKRIEFTDRDFEESITLRAFLKIASEGWVGETTHDMFDLVPLVIFLKKYDCSAGLRIFLAQIGCQIQQDRSTFHPFAPFIIGALADDEKTCLIALAGYEKKWPTKPSKHWIPGKHVFDPSSFPHWAAQWLPASYHSAISRAWGLVGCTAELPREFSKQLAAARKYERWGAVTKV